MRAQPLRAGPDWRGCALGEGSVAPPPSGRCRLQWKLASRRMKRTIRRSSREDLAQTGKWSRRSLTSSPSPLPQSAARRGPGPARPQPFEWPLCTWRLGRRGHRGALSHTHRRLCLRRLLQPRGSERRLRSSQDLHTPAAALPASGSALPPRLWRAEAEPQMVCAAARTRPRHKGHALPPSRRTGSCEAPPSEGVPRPRGC